MPQNSEPVLTPNLYTPLEVHKMTDPVGGRIFSDDILVAQFRNRVQMEENHDEYFVRDFRMWLEFQNGLDCYSLMMWVDIFMRKVIE